MTVWKSRRRRRFLVVLLDLLVRKRVSAAPWARGRDADSMRVLAARACEPTDPSSFVPPGMTRILDGVKAHLAFAGDARRCKDTVASAMDDAEAAAIAPIPMSLRLPKVKSAIALRSVAVVANNGGDAVAGGVEVAVAASFPGMPAIYTSSVEAPVTG